MYSSPPSAASTQSTSPPGSTMSSRRMVPVTSDRKFLLSAESIVFTDLAQAVLAVCCRTNTPEPEKRVLYDIELLGLRPYFLLDRATGVEYPILGHPATWATFHARSVWWPCPRLCERSQRLTPVLLRHLHFFLFALDNLQSRAPLQAFSIFQQSLLYISCILTTHPVL